MRLIRLLAIKHQGRADDEFHHDQQGLQEDDRQLVPGQQSQ